MPVTLSVGQSAQLSVNPTLNSLPVSLFGVGGSTVAGEVQWTVNDATKVQLTPSLDGQTCLAKGLVAGAATVTAKLATTGGLLTTTLAVTVAGAPNTPDAITIVVGSVTGP